MRWSPVSLFILEEHHPDKWKTLRPQPERFLL
jgi:hypothetical protein